VSGVNRLELSGKSIKEMVWKKGVKRVSLRLGGKKITWGKEGGMIAGGGVP